MVEPQKREAAQVGVLRAEREQVVPDILLVGKALGGGVMPVDPYPNLAARFAAAAFSAALGRAGTTTFPSMKSAMPSPFVSVSIQPVAKASATRPAFGCCV